MFRKICTLLMLVLMTWFSPAAAQEGYPLQDSLPVITAENTANLTELASIGSSLPDGLAWSPDGQTLAVGLSDKVLLYDVTELTQPRLTLPARGIGHINAAGVLFTNDGLQWDIKTGLRLSPEIGETFLSPSGNIQVSLEEYSIALVKSSGERFSYNFSEEDSFFPDTTTFYAITFSPDERRALLTTQTPILERGMIGQIYSVYLWDSEHGRFITPLISQEALLDAPNINFHADGRLVVGFPFNLRLWDGIIIGMDSFDIAMWDAETGKNIFTSNDENTQHLEVNVDDNRFVFLQPLTHELIVWAADQQLGTIPYTAVFGRRGYDFSADGRRLIVQQGDEIQFWDISGDALPVAPSVILQTEGDVINFRGVGDQIMFVKADHSIEVRDIHTGQLQSRLETLMDGVAIQISPDGKLASGSFSIGPSAETRVYRIASGEQLMTIKSGEFLSPDWVRVAAWKDGVVSVQEVNSDLTTLIPLIEPFWGEFAAFNVAANQGIMATDEQLHGFDLTTGEWLYSLPRLANELSRPRLQFSVDGQRLLHQGQIRKDNEVITTLHVWDIAITPPQQLMTHTTNEQGYWSISPDGRWLAQIIDTCTVGNILRLWDLDTGTIFGGSERRYCGVHSYQFSPDGQWLTLNWASLVGWNYQVTLHDLTQLASADADTFSFFEDVDPNLTLQLSNRGGYTHVHIFSEDNQWVTFEVSNQEASGESTHYGQVFRWADILSQTPENPAQSIISIPDGYSPRVSPDGRWLINSRGIWEIETWKWVRIPNESTMNFSPDSALIAVNDRQTISIWELSHHPTQIFTATIPNLDYGGFSPDGTRLYVASRGKIQVFGVTEG